MKLNHRETSLLFEVLYVLWVNGLIERIARRVEYNERLDAVLESVLLRNNVRATVASISNWRTRSESNRFEKEPLRKNINYKPGYGKISKRNLASLYPIITCVDDSLHMEEVLKMRRTLVIAIDNEISKLFPDSKDKINSTAPEETLDFNVSKETVPTPPQVQKQEDKSNAGQLNLFPTAIIDSILHDPKQVIMAREFLYSELVKDMYIGFISNFFDYMSGRVPKEYPNWTRTKRNSWKDRSRMGNN